MSDRPAGEGKPFSKASLRVIRSFRFWLWMLVVIGAVVPVAVVSYLPSLDYYQWVFEGYLTSRVIAGHELPELYELSATPVPNLASSVMLGFLGQFMDPHDAGRVFVVLTALLFAFGFGFLTRSVQRRPTAIEFLGLPWAFGYFLYMGYLSYLFAIALALLSIGLLHRIYLSNQGLTGWRFVGLVALGIALYLSHFFGWAVFALVLVIVALKAVREGRREQGGRLVLTLVPPALLLGWYVAGTGDPTETAVYGSLADKLYALVHPFMFVLRTDPFAQVAPVFWVNVLFLGLILLFVFWNFDRWPPRDELSPVFVAGPVLIGMATILPFSWLAGLLRPDERLLFAGVVLVLATIPQRQYSHFAAAVAVCLVLLVAGFHTVEYREANAHLSRFEEASDGNIPDDARLLSLSVREADLTRNSCEAAGWGHSMGVPVLQHFSLNRLYEPDPRQANLFGTGLIAVGSINESDMIDLEVEVITPDQLRVDGTGFLDRADGFDYVVATGCQRYLMDIETLLQPALDPVSSGQGFVIFERE